jgi:sugar lactone lactonase YvrE
MATNTETYVQADLADGTITRLLGAASDPQGNLWTIAQDQEGRVVAYAPMHLVLLTGEICRDLKIGLD